MRIEKIVKIFVITAIAISAAFSFSQTTEASTISIEKAAEKIYKAETKAYNTKKDVNVTVKIPSRSGKLGSVLKSTKKLENALIKKELGDVDLTYVTTQGEANVIRSSIGGVYYYIGTEECGAYSLANFYCPASIGADQDVSYNNGALTIKMKIKGSKKYYRDQYYENTCLAKCIKELRTITEDMDKKNTAWAIAQWLDSHMKPVKVIYPDDYNWYQDVGQYDIKYISHTEPHYFLNKKARGTEEEHAYSYWQFACLLGLNAGYVHEVGYAGNCVKIDEDVYYFTWEDWSEFSEEWEALNNGEEDAISNSRISSVKEWAEGTSIGEWCLLTKKEYRKVTDCSAGFHWIWWRFNTTLC